MTSEMHQPALTSLVVDDHRVSRRYITEALRRCGWTVKNCRSAEEALPLFTEWNPQLLVTDLHLPGADGFELAETLTQKAASRGQAITMLLLSAQTSPALERRACAAGFAGSLRKPLDFNQLRRLLHRIQGVADPATGASGLSTVVQPAQHPDEELLKLFQAELGQRLAKLESFLLCGRFSEAGFLIHQLTASAAICGNRALEICLRELDAANRQPADIPRLAGAFTRLHRCARLVLQQPGVRLT